MQVFLFFFIVFKFCSLTDINDNTSLHVCILLNFDNQTCMKINKKGQNTLTCYILIKIQLCQLKEWVHLLCILVDCVFSQSVVSSSWVHKFSGSLGVTSKFQVLTWSEFHTENPQMLGTTCQHSFIEATWHPGIVHPWSSFIHAVYFGSM